MASGIDKELNILLISSSNPNDNSPKMAFDMVKSLERGGHKIDLLFKYPEYNDSINIISVYSKFDVFKQKIYESLKWRVSAIKTRNKPPEKKATLNYHFFTKNEDKPPVKPSLILNKIKVKYDLVLIFFWQGMLTSKSIFEIYQKLKVPVFLISADMFPMTGGCSYFWDCRNFESSCGKCPAFFSDDKNDFTNQVFMYKKEVYSKINCTFLGNSWMNNYAEKSKLFKNIDFISPVINEEIFKPHSKEELKNQFNLKDKIVLFTGSVDINEDRKGFNYLMEALNLLAEKAPEYANNIVLVIAGGSNLDLQSYFRLKVLQAGRLPFEMLAQYYAMADIYLSPTIQDAGPMMINQALMCGTPTVAFEIGAACDLINEKTGYIAKYKDATDFCNGVIKLLKLSDNEKSVISGQCRELALNKSSYKAFEKRILEIYNKVTENRTINS